MAGPVQGRNLQFRPTGDRCAHRSDLDENTSKSMAHPIQIVHPARYTKKCTDIMAKTSIISRRPGFSGSSKSSVTLEDAAANTDEASGNH
jgi:hypothetical protein